MSGVVLVNISSDRSTDMAGGDKRKMNRKRIRIEEGGVDRITELPIHIREHILGCLILKDAVATSVLSTKWRYCWTGLRKLKFDEDFWGSERYWDFVSDSNLLEHAKIIDRVLSLHIGPICEFILFIPDLHETTLDITTWLPILSKNGVRKIEIAGFHHLPDYFPIPSCLFHCRELEELSVRYSVLTIPSDFMGFAKLTSLSLNNVEIDPSILESLISQCLLLETLSLKNTVFGEPFALKALNLKTFYFNDFELGNIIFKDIPKLTCVSLFAADEIRLPQPYSMLERLHSLSRIKELTFDFFLLEPRPIPDDCPRNTHTPLKNLKSLTLRSVNLSFSDDVLFTLYLIRSAPNLQNLIIHFNSKVERPLEAKKSQVAAQKLLESEAKKYSRYNSLKTIKIGGIEWLQNETLLLKLLKTRCQNVKIIIIETGN